MAKLLLPSTQSCPTSVAAVDSPTPPAKRFAANAGGGSGCGRAASLRGSPPSADSDSVFSAERFRRYDLALRIYTGVRSGRLAAGELRFPDSTTFRRSVYRLVFDLLYHHDVIEELLTESGFYARNCSLHGHESLVSLMAYDYQDSKFSLKLPRDGSENVPAEMLTVARALCKHRVRLSAALARMRVKCNAQSTSQLMSKETLAKYHSTLTQPFHFRINTSIVSSIQCEVVGELCGAGLALCASRDELNSGCGRQFFQQERDLLAFSPDARDEVIHHPLMDRGCLILQDSASYYLVEAMRDLLSQCSGDVVVTHCNAGVELAHIASLLTGSRRVIAYGALPMQMESLTKTLHIQQLDNIDFVHAPFTSSSGPSPDMNKVSTIICLPPSSLSTVTQPLDFILQEGDEFAPLLLSGKKNLRNSLQREQSSSLTHALSLSQCRHVVYAVRSCESHETSNIITACLEHHNTCTKEREYIRVPSDSDEPHSCDAGYHITFLQRKPEDPKPTATEVIAKAITSGVLSGEGLAIAAATPPHLQHTHKKKRKKPTRIFSQHSGIPMTISAQNKITTKKTTAHDANSRRPFR